MTIGYIVIIAEIISTQLEGIMLTDDANAIHVWKGIPLLFFSKFWNNKFDEASCFHTEPIKVHMAVNLRDEMDTIITQKYKKNLEMPAQKRERIKWECREI